MARYPRAMAQKKKTIAGTNAVKKAEHHIMQLETANRLAKDVETVNTGRVVINNQMRSFAQNLKGKDAEAVSRLRKDLNDAKTPAQISQVALEFANLMEKRKYSWGAGSPFDKVALSAQNIAENPATVRGMRKAMERREQKTPTKPFYRMTSGEQTEYMMREGGMKLGGNQRKPEPGSKRKKGAIEKTLEALGIKRVE